MSRTAVAAVDLDQVDRADHPAGLADRAGQLPEHARRVVELDADRETVLRAWGGAHGGGSSVVGGTGC